MATLKTKKTSKKVEKYFNKKIHDLTPKEKEQKKKQKLNIELDGVELNDIKQALFFIDDQAFDKYEEYNPKFFKPFRQRVRALAKFFFDIGA